MLFDGLQVSDVDFLLYYFENVAIVETQGEEPARALIIYSRGEAFKFYFSKFTVRGVLRDEKKNYELIREALKERFGQKKDLHTSIESAVSTKMGKDKPTSPFIYEVSQESKEAVLTGEHKFVFLSKAVLNTEEIRQFVAFYALITFLELVYILHEYDESERTFLDSGLNLLREATKDVYLIDRWNAEPLSTGREVDVKSKVDALARR